MVKKLNYLIVTRPNVAHPINVVSQYMSSPTVNHWAAIEQILCYLKGDPRQGILYSNHGHIKIEFFTKAYLAGSKEDRRSTTSCYVLGGNLVSRKSKKQNVVFVRVQNLNT